MAECAWGPVEASAMWGAGVWQCTSPGRCGSRSVGRASVTVYFRCPGVSLKKVNASSPEIVVYVYFCIIDSIVGSSRFILYM